MKTFRSKLERHKHLRNSQAQGELSIQGQLPQDVVLKPISLHLMAAQLFQGSLFLCPM